MLYTWNEVNEKYGYPLKVSEALAQGMLYKVGRGTMQAQVYEGYFVEQDRFIPQGTVRIPMNKRAIVTILDEQPAKDDSLKEHLSAMDKFIATIKASDEEVPELVRVNFNREVDL
ncbi:MAG: hypothetical protein FWC66_09265, partial [Oscillospiraceae bacterium]|nr:hypothetical protein [Oscillospiraceae bacterium]